MAGVLGNIGHWQSKGKGRTLPGFTADPDDAAVGLDEFPANRQSQPSATLFAAQFVIDLIVGVKYALQVSLRYPDSGVGNMKYTICCGLCSSRNADFALRGVAPGVIQQV